MKFIVFLLISLSSFSYEIDYFKQNFRKDILKDTNTYVSQKNFIRLNKIKIGILESKSKETDSYDKQLHLDSHATHIKGIIESLSYSDTSMRYYFSSSQDHRTVAMENDSIFYKASYEYYLLYPKKNVFLETYSDFVSELKLLAESKPDIINVSGGVLINKKDYGMFDVLFEKNIINEHKDIIFVCAAGNEKVKIGEENLFVPSSHNLKNVISVSSMNNGEIIGNFGEVDFGIQAKDIMSKGLYYNVRHTGSSQATAIMTTAIARIKERYPDISLKQILYILKINSKNKEGLKYGEFSYDSFNRWMNKNYSLMDIHYVRYQKNNLLFLDHLMKKIVFI